MHVAAALARGLFAPVTRWAGHPSRRGWAWPLLVALPAAWLLFPFDQAITAWVRGLDLRGDPRREMEALQQFGQGAFSLVLAWSVWLLDPPRRRRLLDWLAAALIGLLATNLLKGLLGRPRPYLEEPGLFVGPVGKHPVPSGDGFVLQSAWEATYALASMPSRHAAFAAIAGVFLSALYPRLTPVCVLLVAIVAFARVATGAHYPSDVALGLGIGLAIARVAVPNLWGVRALDWLWLRVVDRSATPASPAVARAESRRLGPAWRPGAWAARAPSALNGTPTPAQARDEPAAINSPP